jgi:hypothetical protein
MHLTESDIMINAQHSTSETGSLLCPQPNGPHQPVVEMQADHVT